MKLKPLLTIALFSFILSGCFYPQYAFQTARTTEVNDVELGIGTNAGYSSNFDFDIFNIDSADYNAPLPYYDFFVYGRTGLSPRQDIGLALGVLSGSLGIDYKYMLIGDQESPFVFSPGIAMRTSLYSFSTFPFSIEIPLHFSYYPTKNIGLFITPVYIGQKNTIGDIVLGDKIIHRLGISGGIEVTFDEFNLIAAWNRNESLNKEFFRNDYNLGFSSFNLGLSFLIN